MAKKLHLNKFLTTGNITNGSAIITNIPSTSGIAQGDIISGNGIPTDSIVLTINSSSQITIDKNATANTTGVTLAVMIADVVTKYSEKFIAPIDYLDFTVNTTPLNIEEIAGRLFYNDEDDTLNIVHQDGSVQQIGMEFYMTPTINTSGEIITNGSFVMATGANGDRLTIAKAVTDGSIDPMYMIGVATRDIAIGSEIGKITTHGYVRNFNTNAWTMGTVLYPNPAVAGGWTSTKPTAPAIKTPVAMVIRQNSSSGILLVRMTNGSTLGGTDSNVEFTSLQAGDTIAYVDGALNRWENNSTVKINKAAVGTVPLLINALNGQTANLQNWQVNGSTLASITKDGDISGRRLTSTIVTGTAPLVVTSTTRVANLNVATAGIADSANTILTAQKSDNVVYHIPFLSSITAGNQSLFTDSESILTYNPSTNTLSVPNMAISGNLSINNVEMISTSNGIVFEGTTNDTFETTLIAVNPTADQTYQLPNKAAGTYTIATTGDLPPAHPTYDGDDIDLDTTPLTGATVISDLDFNVTTDTTGHVVDANASFATRTLTLADLSYSIPTLAQVTTAGNTTTNTIGTGRISATQGMTAGATAAFTSPHLALIPTDTVDTTGFVGMTFGTSTSANYGFSLGALRSTNGSGSLVARFHNSSATGTEIFRLGPTGDLSVVGNLTVTGNIVVNNIEMIHTSSGIIFEGSANDNFETTLNVVNPTADRSILLPDADGTVALTSGVVSSFSAGTTGLTPSSATTGAVTLGGTLIVGNGGTGTTSFTSGNVLIGAGTGAITTLSRSGIDSRSTFPAAQHSIASHSATAWRMFFSNATTTAIQELVFGAAGTYLRSGGASANPTWATIAYSELSGAPTIGNGTLTLATSGSGISGSASFTANQTGNSTFTVTSNATTSATANTISLRDADGNITTHNEVQATNFTMKYDSISKSVKFIFV
jgi:hypothetical protein